MQVYNPVTRSIYTNMKYNLDLGCHTNIRFGLTYDVGIFVGM